MARSATFLRRLAWVTLGCIFFLVVAAQIVSVEAASGVDGFAFASLSFPVVGALIASRQPRNALGWSMLAVGIGWGLSSVLDFYAWYGLEVHPGSLPRPDVALVLSEPMWVPLIGLMGTFFILLFPDGRLPSPRWRPWARLCVIAMILSFIAILIQPGSFADSGYPNVKNPLGVEGLQPFIELALFVILLIPICIIGCAVGLIRRFRRSRGQERQQLKWLAAAAGVVAAVYLIMMALSLPGLVGREPPRWVEVVDNIGIYAFMLLPLATAIAIFRYRLYDIDVVISKTLVFGALAAFITVVYVGVVVGLGELIGAREDFDIRLSIFATAVVAIAFQPVRERVQRLANRLVYGRRATPYEILSNFTERVANTYTSDEVLPRLAHHLGEATGAVQARVWLAVGDRLVPGASWPEAEEALIESLSLQDGAPPHTAGIDRFVPVQHRGELLGALSVAKAPRDPVRPIEDELLEHLASQAGLVLRNVRLTTELLARLDELSWRASEIRVSRERIVARQDDERRRIERNLHDGAQQHLVAIAVKLRLAITLVSRDSERARMMLTGLRSDMNDALETLRDLAQGIYPAVLSEHGLASALGAQAERSEIRTTITADGIGRYPIETEVAIYFCCLEAMQNFVKYSRATEAVVKIKEIDRELAFTVTDNGMGFASNATKYGSGLSSMADRLESVGGTLKINSVPGKGTTVEGRVPLRSMEPAA
jgi:signal transduction histidine kinase